MSNFRDWERANNQQHAKNIYLMTASGQVEDLDKQLFGGVIEKPVKLNDLHALLDSLGPSA